MARGLVLTGPSCRSGGRRTSTPPIWQLAERILRAVGPSGRDDALGCDGNSGTTAIRCEAVLNELGVLREPGRHWLDPDRSGLDWGPAPGRLTRVNATPAIVSYPSPGHNSLFSPRI